MPQIRVGATDPPMLNLNRLLVRLLLTSALAVGLAGHAHAASLPFTGTLSFEVAKPAIPPISIASQGIALVNGAGTPGHLTSLQVPAGAFASGVALPVTDPAALPLAGFQLTAINDEGNFGGNGHNFGGVMPLEGVVRFCLLAFCPTEFDSNLSVPLSVVGRGGSAFAASGAGRLAFTVIGAPWTVETAAVGTITRMGTAAPISNTGAPSGRISLVTPVFISTYLPHNGVITGFMHLSLHFVPEPTTLAMLGGGVAALVVYGRGRTLD